MGTGAEILTTLIAWGAPLLLLVVVMIRYLHKRRRDQRARPRRSGVTPAGDEPTSEGDRYDAGQSRRDDDVPETGPVEHEVSLNTMRRRNLIIRDPRAIARIVSSARECHVAFASGNEPYLVTLSYGTNVNDWVAATWDEEAFRFLASGASAPCLYFHSARDGRKFRELRRNPRVCLEIIGRTRTVPGEQACKWTARYESVVGFGEIAEVTDDEERQQGVASILRQSGADASIDLPTDALHRVAVLRLTVREFTGKSNWPTDASDHE